MGSLAGSTLLVGGIIPVGPPGIPGMPGLNGSRGGNPGMTGNNLAAAAAAAADDGDDSLITGEDLSPLFGLADLSLDFFRELLRFSGCSSLLSSSLLGPSSPSLVTGRSSGEALRLTSNSPDILSEERSLGLLCSVSMISMSSIFMVGGGETDLDLDLLRLLPNLLVSWDNDMF